MGELDVDTLKQELDDLRARQRELNARRREHGHKGPGRRGGPVRRAFDGDASQELRTERPQRWGSSSEAQIPAPEHSGAPDDGGERRNGRPQIASAVVAPVAPVKVDHRAAEEPQGANSEPSCSKREASAALLEDRPDVKKRNRRLFGALLGTLAQFKREEQDQSHQEVMKRRAEQLQRAEERSRGEFERMRENERRCREEARAKETELQATLRLEADVKQLELFTAQREATEKLREKHQAEREAWKAETLRWLEREKEALRTSAAVHSNGAETHVEDEQTAVETSEGHETSRQGQDDGLMTTSAKADHQNGDDTLLPVAEDKD